MIQKLLVANRGEIALRVFRAARELGVGTVAVVAPDDKGSLHARSADETVEIASYLFSEENIRAAQQTGADAIHPGYGFLAENADFAEAVNAAGLTWVGPPPEALRAGGDKLEAKRIAREAGVPVVPTGEPAEIGFPLVVKAAAGGGGRGMRVVRAASDLDDAIEAAQREAKAPSATIASSASATWSVRGTSRSSCSQTDTETCSRSESANARFSVATRRFSRNRRGLQSTRASAEP